MNYRAEKRSIPDPTPPDPPIPEEELPYLSRKRNTKVSAMVMRTPPQSGILQVRMGSAPTPSSKSLSFFYPFHYLIQIPFIFSSKSPFFWGGAACLGVLHRKIPPEPTPGALWFHFLPSQPKERLSQEFCVEFGIWQESCTPDFVQTNPRWKCSPGG